MIRELDQNNFQAFKAYCLEYRNEHDESYLYDEDFDDFEIGYQNPTYLLVENDEIQGVLSVIQDSYHLKGNKVRVRIFHCLQNRLEDYQLLLDKVLPLDGKAERMIMFLPSEKLISREIVEKLGFTIERYSYVMERGPVEPQMYQFPEGYELTDFVRERDEEAYMAIRNSAFATILGSEVPHTKEQVMGYMKPEQILVGGAKILRYQGSPVGLIRMEHEVEQGKDYSFVAPLAVIPSHQGKGLGSNLLRAGIAIGIENGYKECMLTVNAENENALLLYKKEGFVKTVEVVGYQLFIQ